MPCTYRHITCWEADNIKARTYSNLASNDETAIVRWLHQQGVICKRCSGVECHDIGDTDYFCGNIETDDINAVLTFMDKLFGEWTMNAIYNGIDIVISKAYPNVTHQLSFKHSNDEETIMQLFVKFEQEFCYPDIKETEEYR